MKVLILGGDGYLGWPTAMHFAARGHEVFVVDNYSRRKIAEETNSQPLFDTPDLSTRCKVFERVSGHAIGHQVADLGDSGAIQDIFQDFPPDVVVHYAEQPSAPYSMMGFKEAEYTLKNNLTTTFNLIWAILENAPRCHLIKLGTMGEYGTPNIDIEEGFIEISHKGRQGKFLYPRQASSLYHTTKILDTDLLFFYARTYNLAVTDLMQGPVYGVATPETDLDPRLLPNFHYDDIFGTVINRFLVQAVAGMPLTVYGKGGQKRGYININDTLQCIQLSAENPAPPGELRIFNQFTQTFSVNELARMVKQAAEKCSIAVKVEHLENPRKEAEDHYYNPAHRSLKDLGLQEQLLTEDVLIDLIKIIQTYRDKIDESLFLPRVRWNNM